MTTLPVMAARSFCILLPGTTETQALVLADRIRRLFTDLIIEWDGNIISSSVRYRGRRY